MLKGKVLRTEPPMYPGKLSSTGALGEESIDLLRSEEPPPSSADGTSILKEVKIEPFDLHEHMYATTSNRLVRMERDLAPWLLGAGPFKNSPRYGGGCYYTG